MNDAGSLLGRAGFSLPAVDAVHILKRPLYCDDICKYTRVYLPYISSFFSFSCVCQDTITYHFPDAMTLMHALQVFKTKKLKKTKTLARV